MTNKDKYDNMISKKDTRLIFKLKNKIMNKPFIIHLGFSHDQKFIVRDMKKAKSKHQLYMETALAEKIADHQMILPADIGGHAVSITILRSGHRLIYSAQIVQRLSSDKNVFEKNEIFLKTGNFIGDLKEINCSHRIVVSNNLEVDKRVREKQLTKEVIEKRDAANELGQFKIPGINTKLIAARLGAR